MVNDKTIVFEARSWVDTKSHEMYLTKTKEQKSFQYTLFFNDNDTYATKVNKYILFYFPDKKIEVV